MILRIVIYGRPEPQGSTRAFIPKGWTRPIITSDNKKLKGWRQDLAHAAQRAVFAQIGEGEHPIPRGVPVSATVRLYYSRPQKEKGRYKPTKPDVDKALRACLDGLTGIVYADDSQVARVVLEKFFGSPERAEIEIEEISGADNGALL